ncbi:MAG: exodeoxyribonuclease III, partial [Spirochaetia bacterium]
MKHIFSWNANGIRATARKGFGAWFRKADPDIPCVQETKAHPDGYHAYWAWAQKKGYAGVAVFSKEEPVAVSRMGIDRFDSEARVLQLEYRDLVSITAYFPNSRSAGIRLDYKLDFCNSLKKICDDHVAAGRRVVLCGDYNVSHKPIDLARPKENERNAGYLPEERSWMDELIGAGYVDTFRMFNQEGGNYTWWSMMTKGRERNVGWRLDYHCVDPKTAELVRSAEIHSDVM